MFHGSAAALDDDWLNLSLKYIHSAMKWTGSLRKYPVTIRPIVYRFVSGLGQMRREFSEGHGIVAKTLDRRIQHGKPLDDPPSLLDWLADPKIGGATHSDVEMHTIAQMNLLVAALQSMASTVMQCLIDLAEHPEYVPELREEISKMLAEAKGVLSRQALSDMMKLDSFIKETQRFNSPDLSKSLISAGPTVATGLLRHL
jgi:cytochrome P450